MRLIDYTANAFYLRGTGGAYVGSYNPSVLLSTLGNTAAVQFRGGGTSASPGAQVAADISNPFNAIMSFDATGASWKWRSALNDDNSLRMQLDNNGLRVTSAYPTFISSSSGLSVRLGVFSNIISNATDAFVGVANTGGPGGGYAGDLILMPRSSTGYTNAIRMLTGQGTPAERFTIDTNGNIGMGNSAPGYALDLKINSGANSGLRIDQGTASKQAYIAFSDRGSVTAIVGKQTDNTFFMYDNVKARDFLEVDANGNLRLLPNDPSGNYGNVVIGNNSSLAAGATSGFLFIPSIAGTPGTPNPTTSTFGSAVPICYDRTNQKICVYDGSAWKKTAALT